MRMNQIEVLPTALHEIPGDVLNILKSDDQLLIRWNELTPLARNEWVCWITSVKKDETRQKHIKRMQEEVLNGKKRPCCWPGCSHRKQ